MRNHRGLKPFQLARANGHSSIARQLCDTRSTRTRHDRRRRTAEGGSGGGGGGGAGRAATTPEALLTMLIQVHTSRPEMLFIACPVNARALRYSITTYTYGFWSLIPAVGLILMLNLLTV